jgi:hypothetical protein
VLADHQGGPLDAVHLDPQGLDLLRVGVAGLGEALYAVADGARPAVGLLRQHFE